MKCSSTSTIKTTFPPHRQAGSQINLYFFKKVFNHKLLHYHCIHCHYFDRFLVTRILIFQMKISPILINFYPPSDVYLILIFSLVFSAAPRWSTGSVSLNGSNLLVISCLQSIKGQNKNIIIAKMVFSDRIHLPL